MKRALLLLLISILTIALVACSEDKGNETKAEKEESTQEEDKENNSKSEENMSQAEWMEKNHPEKMSSTDPLEVGNKNNDVNIYQDGPMTEKIVARYTSKEMDEDGFNTIKFKDSELRFSVALVEDEDGNQEIGVFGEKNNNMDVLLDYSETFSIKTDQKEKAHPSFDFGGGIEPGVKEKFFDTFSLEYDIPETFTFTMRKPAENEEESLMWEDEKEIITEIEFKKE